MSDTALIVFIIHPAIIVPLALALSDLQMNLSLKFLFVAPIAVFILLLQKQYGITSYLQTKKRFWLMKRIYHRMAVIIRFLS
jgi:hypothetical protein